MMKKLLENRKIQKLFLPLAFLCILAVWCVAMWADPFHPLCYMALALGLIFYILDRQLKPREHERAERRQAKLQGAEAKSAQQNKAQEVSAMDAKNTFIDE